MRFGAPKCEDHLSPMVQSLEPSCTERESSCVWIPERIELNNSQHVYEVCYTCNVVAIECKSGRTKRPFRFLSSLMWLRRYMPTSGHPYCITWRTLPQIVQVLSIQVPLSTANTAPPPPYNPITWPGNFARVSKSSCVHDKTTVPTSRHMVPS